MSILRLFIIPFLKFANSLATNFEKNLKFTEPFEQFDDEIKLKSIFPGDLQTYTLKQQCQQIFGSESDACQQNLVRIEINLNLIIFLLFII